MDKPKPDELPKWLVDLAARYEIDQLYDETDEWKVRLKAKCKGPGYGPSPEQTVEFYRGMTRERFDEMMTAGSLPVTIEWDEVQRELSRRVRPG